MQKLLIFTILLLITFSAYGESNCYRKCAEWDTFCKSPKQIVATKCRLGVPVKHEQCKILSIPSHYLVRGGGSFVDGLPCSYNKLVTDNDENKKTYYSSTSTSSTLRD